MNVFAIKILAMLSMVIDHLGLSLYREGLISSGIFSAMRSVGRISFPLFCFLIVNGYEHSSDRKKYLARLIGFAALSQMPYRLVFERANYAASAFGAVKFTAPGIVLIVLAVVIAIIWYRFVKADITALLPALALIVGFSTLRAGDYTLLGGKMNVFYTLALSLAIMGMLDAALNDKKRDATFPARAAATVLALIILWDKTEYGINGIVLIVMLWFFHTNRIQQIAVIVLWSIVQYLVSGQGLAYFLCASASVLPIYFYNGRRGKALKTTFYLVYPLHLLLLGLTGI